VDVEKEEQKPLGVGEGGVKSQCKVDGIDPVLLNDLDETLPV